MQPAYLNAYSENILQQRAQTALQRLECCELCPRRCRVNRLKDEKGFCKTGRHAVVSSYSPHFGEESVLVGRYGSGTVFFTNCNLLCVFCQNHEISHKSEGVEADSGRLAQMILGLQNMNVHNINFVSPSHVVPQILEALVIAVEKGLKVPLVYNSGGYDSVETLALLDGIFDIYMPDLKFVKDIPPTLYCRAPDYPDVVKKAIKEMHRQVGDLTVDTDNRAVSGLLVRHLVMPDNLAGTDLAMAFLAGEISKNTYVNIMNQYRPCGELSSFPELKRKITDQEYSQALDDAQHAGITRIDDRNRGFLLYWR